MEDTRWVATWLFLVIALLMATVNAVSGAEIQSADPPLANQMRLQTDDIARATRVSEALSSVLDKVRLLNPPVTLPEITAVTLPDQEVSLREIVQNADLTILNLWATWCPPCVKELPALETLAAGFDAKETQIIALSVDFKGHAVVTPFWQKHEFTHLVPLIDQKSTILTELPKVGIFMQGLPQTLIVDRNGLIHAVIAGDHAWDRVDITDSVTLKRKRHDTTKIKSQ
jgi:thiol-disulfide isomerase/thioredoxin